MKKGFTLIELLAVVLIMGILTSVALPQYRRSLERTRVAEAEQMLPAIFDARERLLAENGWKWSTDYNKVTFSKLDIDLKGSAQGTQEWVTPTFLYKLVVSNSAGTVYSGEGTPAVSAVMRKGRNAESRIIYSGSTFTCCNPGGDNSKRNMCDDFNLPINLGCGKVAKWRGNNL